MWIAMNDLLKTEREEFRLLESCEQCTHYCDARSQCGVLYPVEPHLKKSFDEAQNGDRIYFCKMFEVK